MDQTKKFNPEEHFMDLKGKKYLQVMWRLVWFREDHPDWCISTEIIEHVHGDHAVFKAIIMDPATEQIFSEGHGSETSKDFKDYLEKAETKAIGRALAMLGYGTQFAPELDEGERLADSPVDTKNTTTDKKQDKTPDNKQAAAAPVPSSLPVPPANKTCAECGKIITDATAKNGMEYTAAQIIEMSMNRFGKCYCASCMGKMSK